MQTPWFPSFHKMPTQSKLKISPTLPKPKVRTLLGDFLPILYQSLPVTHSALVTSQQISYTESFRGSPDRDQQTTAGSEYVYPICVLKIKSEAFEPDLVLARPLKSNGHNAEARCPSGSIREVWSIRKDSCMFSQYPGPLRPDDREGRGLSSCDAAFKKMLAMFEREYVP